MSEPVLDLDLEVGIDDDVGHAPALLDADHDSPAAVPAPELTGDIAILIPDFLVPEQLHVPHLSVACFPVTVKL